MNKQNVILLIFLQILGQLFYSGDRAFASSCPFDSYIIIGGVCHDATQEPKNLTIEKAKPSPRNYSPKFEHSEPKLSTKKQCGDFETQESAQYYLERNPEYKHLDIDGNGYACGHLQRSKDLLTSKIWHNLTVAVYGNDNPLTYHEALNIIGFPPNRSIRNKEIWEEPIDNQKIEIIFFKGKAINIKGTGFK